MSTLIQSCMYSVYLLLSRTTWIVGGGGLVGFASQQLCLLPSNLCGDSLQKLYICFTNTKEEKNNDERKKYYLFAAYVVSLHTSNEVVGSLAPVEEKTILSILGGGVDYKKWFM